MRYTTKFISLLLLAFTTACNTPQPQEEKLTSYVDPFIGTAGHGHVFPGATTPFGMVQLSPVNGISAWDWCSGYHHSSNKVSGFAHMCLSGTGIGDMADIMVLPTTQQVVEDTGKTTKEESYQFISQYKSTYKKSDEIAEPGYYRTILNEGDIEVELTASPRVGFHKYSFKNNTSGSVIVDLGFAVNWDAPVETFIQQESPTLFTGYRKSKGWAADQWVYFALECSQPAKDFRVLNHGKNSSAKSGKAKYIQGILDFDLANKKSVLLKVGLSSASIEGAKLSIEKELPDWDFEKQRRSTMQLWENELQKIKIETPDLKTKKIFYTALYHSMVAPYLHSDHNGQYKGLDGEIQIAEGFDRYTIFSLWDTFRANHPLFTITQPDKVKDFVQSFMAIYREGGLLPVWELAGNETNCMIGYHSIPVICDAWQKGLLQGMDGKELLNAMVKSAMQDKGGLKALREYGYIPWELENESVSKALEYAYDDWCIAQMAKSVSEDSIYQTFIKRAAYYKNHFDPSTHFMRGKNAKGQWKEGFDPLFSSHRDDEYTEGNAWQYSWFVPHDVNGLVQLHGGKEAFVQHLDSLFLIEEDVKGEKASPDISGLIGQYAHGNEPSHHVAYLYNYVGMPWKSAEKVDKILTTMYTDKVDGLCGNEDCGQMSAWYVLSSMGFYPVNPANGNYQIGRPLMDKATINLPNGKAFTVIAENNSKNNIYIQKALLNGQPLNQSWFTHEQMLHGGTLTLVMGEKPNTSWATTQLPPAMNN